MEKQLQSFQIAGMILSRSQNCDEKPKMELYHPVKIGSLELEGNLFLAPVAGYTDKAFRSICAEAGANFSYTELVSAESLVRGNDASVVMLQPAECEKKYAVQIFGSNPETIARAVKIVLEKSRCDCIDINCGCPVPKVVKTGAGAALTRDAERLYEVAKAAVESAESAKRAVPITVKIRSGWDAEHITWREAADAAIKAGVAAITLHPRTRAQGYEGKADWSCLKALVDFVRESCGCDGDRGSDGSRRGSEAPAATNEPALVNGQSGARRVAVFGSGDLFSPESARDMLEQTGCDGVMFARGAMGNPFIFPQTLDFLRNGRYEEPLPDVKIKTGMRELELLTAECGEDRACKEMRKRFCSYTKGMAGGAALRARLVHAETKKDYEEIFSVLPILL